MSEFTICRNVLKYDYPVLASLKSLLPLVDERVVNVGTSGDGTLDLIRSLRDPKIRHAMARHVGDPAVTGLTVRYHHVWGDYWTIHPWRYRWHVRIVRPGGSVESYKDACGFWYPDRTLPLKDGPSSAMKPTGGRHYGWEEWQFPKSEYKALKRFRGPHPATMAEVVAKRPDRLYPDVRSRWLNPEFWSYTLRHGIRL